MQNLRVIQTLSIGDVRNIRRDSLLLWISFVPLLTALVFRIAVPWLADWLLQTYALDISPYQSAISGFLLILMTPVMFGVVIGFLLLDERDDETLTALQVTPLPLSGYLLYRLGMPVVLSVLMSWLVFPLAAMALLPLERHLAMAVLAALEAPLYALFLAAFAGNKVSGLALFKAVNAIVMLPLVAAFIPGKWQLLGGIIPTYWPLKFYWAASDGGLAWPYFVIGVIYHLALLGLLLKRFERVLHR